MFAHPVNATAFSVTDSYFRRHGRFPRATSFSATSRVCPTASNTRTTVRSPTSCRRRSPAAILENDGVLVTGSSVLDAFDRLEVLESTAEAVINARAIGEVSTMPDTVISELREAFKIE